jgi:hypothetical protein
MTTMWDEEDEIVANHRVTQLQKDFFLPILDGGGSMIRFDGDSKSAWSIIDKFVDTRFATLLQEELVDLEKKLCETDAGRQLHGILAELVAQQKRSAREIGKELDELGQTEEASSARLVELRQEYEDLRLRLAGALEDMRKLDNPIATRILRMLWLPRKVRGWNVAREYIHS